MQPLTDFSLRRLLAAVIAIAIAGAIMGLSPASAFLGESESTATLTEDVTRPSVGWQAPTTGSSVSGKLEGRSCVAGASDDQGVERVEFRLDGAPLNTERVTPYNCYFDTTTVADGAHTLTATAYDVAGNARSASIVVNVANGPPPDTALPTLAWQAPTTGATVSGRLAGDSCIAGAADDQGVERVEFRLDGAPLNTERVTPYNCYFDTTTVADGAHTLTATAYDVAGNARSASIVVNVANGPPPDTAPPTLAWQAPTTGATVSGRLAGDSCVAGAADDQGVERVEFRLDGSTLNTERVTPYNCYFDTTTVADGAHTLTATAYDVAGNARSASIVVSVSNATPSPTPEPPVDTGALVVGIDGGYAGWSSTETVYRTQLGAAVTRHEWNPTQPVNAQDALVLKAAAQVRTRIHALLGGNQLGNATSYREWVVAFVRRYGRGGSFWAEHPELDASRYAITTIELGNEPYFGEMSAALYADTVRPTLERIAQLGLPVKVILPSRVYGTDTSWIDTLYQRIANLNSLFYAFADHPYWYGRDPAQISPAGPFGRIDVLRRRMNEKGASAKPIFITEYGQSTANCGIECVSETVQAEHLSKMLNATISRTYWKVEMISIFQLLDRGTNSADRELQFGLLRQNGTQKPSYSIVRGMMQR